MNDTTTKHCPGFTDPGGADIYSQAAHEVAADTEHFGVNRSAKDGLGVYCRPCDRAYQKAWREAKARGEKLNLRPAAGKPASAPATPTATVTVRTTRPSTVYHDQLAVDAARGKAPGYTAETIGGKVYALPTDPAIVKTPAGQAALAACNEAKLAERRKRDADQKRAERAAKKQPAAAPAVQ